MSQDASQIGVCHCHHDSCKYCRADNSVVKYYQDLIYLWPDAAESVPYILNSAWMADCGRSWPRMHHWEVLLSQSDDVAIAQTLTFVRSPKDESSDDQSRTDLLGLEGLFYCLLERRLGRNAKLYSSLSSILRTGVLCLEGIAWYIRWVDNIRYCKCTLASGSLVLPASPKEKQIYRTRWLQRYWGGASKTIG